MNKKSTLFLLLAFSLGSVKAQTTFGIKAGVNLNSYTSFNNNQTTFVGSHVTGFVDVPVSTYLSIQPGLSWQQKGTKYPSYLSDLRVNTVITRTVNALEVPLNLVAHLPLDNAGEIFFGLGPYIGYNISAQDRSRVITGYGRQTWEIDFNGESATANRNMNRLEGGANFLAGYQLKIGLLVSAQYGWGMSQLIPDNDNTVSNKTWSFSLGYRF